METLVLHGDIYKNCYIHKMLDPFDNQNADYWGFYEGEFYNGIPTKETFYLPGSDIILKDFSFILVTKGVFQQFFCGILGLNFNSYIKGNKDDFIYQLKQNSFIKYIVFSIGINRLIIGNKEIIPHKGSTIKSELILKPGDNKEAICFKINSIVIYDEYQNAIYWSKEEKLVGILEIDINEIFCPKKFFKFFIDKLFKGEIDSGICEIEFLQKINRIICSKMFSPEKIKGGIYFFINNKSIKLKISDLFVQLIDRSYEFMIQYNKFKEGWFFGGILNKKFIITIDREENYIYLTKEN